MLPMLELVEQTEVAIDEVIQVMGRATIEAVLKMSAEGVAGVKQAGRSRAEDDTVWYGRQGGVVYLSDRKVRVERPRLRRRGGSSPELCVKVRGSSSMLLLSCLGDLLRFEKREIQVATFAPDRSSP